jgi:hypothetical protein
MNRANRLLTLQPLAPVSIEPETPGMGRDASREDLPVAMVVAIAPPSKADPPPLLTYAISTISSRRLTSSTRPRQGTIRAIIKADCAEAPHAVFDELVAARLGQALNLPVAAGMIAILDGELAFASCEVELRGRKLRNLALSRNGQVVAEYPSEAAGLFAFDVWIGNWDRSQNLKATLPPNTRGLVAFDHSHALLDIEPTIEASLSRLDSLDLVAEQHPLGGLASPKLIRDWIERIEELPKRSIIECCLVGPQIRAVEMSIQWRLADALARRRDRLRDILSALIP